MEFNDLSSSEKSQAVSALLSDIERYQEYLYNIYELGLRPEYKKIVKE